VREQEMEASSQARIAQQTPVPAPKSKTSFTAAPFLAARNLIMRNSSGS
jgi:hypothetical protein